MVQVPRGTGLQLKQFNNPSLNQKMKTKKMTTLHLKTSISRSLSRSGLFSIAIALTWSALSPMARGVLPPPDGGYPGHNTAEGTDALFSLTTGTGDTAIGFHALFNNTTGQHNTASGAIALFANTTGASNTATGWAALANNTDGFNNTASGVGALHSNTEGSYNTANGYNALWHNGANYNTAGGAFALVGNTTGGYNMANGALALFGNTTGTENTASGARALQSNRTGDFNTASGFDALVHNYGGSGNTGNGHRALWLNANGHDNTAAGVQALYNATGSFNIALGSNAGVNLGSGHDNIYIGNAGVAGDSNIIRIGEQGTHDATFIAGIAGATVASGVGVIVDADGRLGTVTSSARFKETVKPMDKASEAVLALEPVTFHYKKELDSAGIPQFGLIAEQVEKVNPDLVAKDEDGKAYTVRYEAVNAMLLNEFLKEHRKVQEQDATIAQVKSTAAKQEATIAQQQKQIEALTAGLQKVSARLEASKPAPRVVNNRKAAVDN